MQTYDYLANLPLSQTQKELVTQAEYENPPTLYMICKVIPVAMKEYLGLDSLDELETALWQMLTPEEREGIEKELALLNEQKENAEDKL